MSYLNLFRKRAVADEVQSELHRSREAIASSLSPSSIIDLLLSSHTALEARYAAKLLEDVSVAHAVARTLGNEATELHDAVKDDVGELVELVRGARSTYEAMTTIQLLNAAVENTRGVGGPATAEPLAARAKQTDELLSSVSVLVVEDDPAYRDLLVATLRRSGASVTAVADVDSAVKIMTQRSPDVVISDIELPGRSGYDLMRRIQSATPRMPVLAISGHPQDPTALRDAGFRLFFGKEEGALRKIVETIARMPEVTAPRLPIVAQTKRTTENRGE
jgi:CheY-like chemotaxis protein